MKRRAIIWLAVFAIVCPGGVLWYVLAPDLTYPSWVPKSARWIRASVSGQWLAYDAQMKFETP